MSQPFQLSVEGMHCPACVRRVRAAVEKVAGVTVGEVTVGSVAGTLEGATIAEVAAAVDKAGYSARPV